MKRVCFSLFFLFIYFALFSQDNAVSLFYDNYYDKDLTTRSIDLVFEDGSGLYSKGQRDAKSYYKDYRPFTGTFISSLLFPPAGLVTTIVVSSKKPKEYNLGIPDSKKMLLVESDDYLNGYISQAKKRKRFLAWSGFVTGSTFFITGLAMFGYISPN